MHDPGPDVSDIGKRQSTGSRAVDIGEPVLDREVGHCVAVSESRARGATHSSEFSPDKHLQ
jgi:hypothetical protein